MTSLTAIVTVRRHGREAVPTLRSILRAATELTTDDLGIQLVTTPDAGEYLTRWLATQSISLPISITHSSTNSLSEMIRDGIFSSSGDYLALFDAGDLVSANWFRLGLIAAARSGGSARPAMVLTFGRRSGTWPQLSWDGTDDDRPAALVAHMRVWSPTLIGARSVLEPAFRQEGSALPSGIRLVLARVRQIPVSGTVGFHRVWTDSAPWESTRPVLTPLSALPGASQRERHAVSPTTRPGLPTQLARRAWIRLRRLPLVRRTVPVRERFAPDVRRMWVEQNRIEPLLPFPRPAVDTWYERWGEPYPPDLCLSIDAYWQIATRLPSHIDYLFFAPWFNTGGGDSVLLEYLRAVQRADPMATVALITTENAESRRIRELPPEVHVVELREFLGQGVPRSAFVDWIIPQVIAQKRVRTVHAFNSTIAYDVVERWGRELDAICNIFLSTFSFDRTEDGERTSVLFLRRPDFLAPVRAVLVDSQHFAHAAVAELGYPAEKFAVQRSVVDLPVDSARLGADSRTDALRVLWAGRFDLAKRLDIFADIVAESRARKLPFEFHFYGEPVMADAAIDKVLAELEAYGAHRHPPYERFAELPLSRFGAYILTSEWEGVPLSLLEAMGCGIPSVAADVGGVNEVLDNTTGYPVADFRDVGSYVDRLEEIWAEPELARARSAAAMKRVRDRHTPRAFDASLAEIAGYLRDPATMSSPTTATNELHE